MSPTHSVNDRLGLSLVAGPDSRNTTIGYGKVVAPVTALVSSFLLRAMQNWEDLAPPKERCAERVPRDVGAVDLIMKLSPSEFLCG